MATPRYDTDYEKEKGMHERIEDLGDVLALGGAVVGGGYSYFSLYSKGAVRCDFESARIETRLSIREKVQQGRRGGELSRGAFGIMTRISRNTCLRAGDWPLRRADEAVNVNVTRGRTLVPLIGVRQDVKTNENSRGDRTRYLFQALVEGTFLDPFGEEGTFLAASDYRQINGNTPFKRGRDRKRTTVIRN